MCGSQIRRILRTQITVTLPPLWQAAVKDARAAKRNKWRGPAQRGGGRLCRLRVSLRAACQSGTQKAQIFSGAQPQPKTESERDIKGEALAGVHRSLVFKAHRTNHRGERGSHQERTQLVHQCEPLDARSTASPAHSR